MALKLYTRGQFYWFKGKIDEIPKSKYYRQSTGKCAEVLARTVLREFEQQEIEAHFGNSKARMTFAEAVLIYDANPETARDLKIILPQLADRFLDDIKPIEIMALGKRLYPESCADSWRRHVVTPIRAVINNAHKHGHCGAIKIPGYSKNEVLMQDRIRGKRSRVERKAGSWPWLLKFRTEANPRMAALALFMFETAARIGQATRINFGDLDVDNSRVRMPEAKGAEAQWVDLSAELCAELAVLEPQMVRVGNRRGVRSKRLFGYQGKGSVYKSWRRACVRAEIDIIMPHAAGRHGFGTELVVRQGLDPVTVARAGRWSDPSMLLTRYAHAENFQPKVDQALRTGRVQASVRNPVKTLKLRDK